MIDFHELQLEDRLWADPLLHRAEYIGCEFCFGNMYIWRRTYNTRIAKVGGNLTTFCHGDQNGIYLFPTGPADLRGTIELLRQDARERGIPFSMFGVYGNNLQFLESLYPGQFSKETSDDWADYIYRASDLIHLPGQKYHGKRNHIARFRSQYDYTYEPLTARNLGECRAMWMEWQTHHDKSVETENDAVRDAFDYFEALGLSGGLIRAAEKGGGAARVVAFSMGEPINDDVYCVHIEKAFADVEGAYPVINQEFSAANAGDRTYINREEDLGIDGLRRAKQSYHPVMWLKKYRVTFYE